MKLSFSPAELKRVFGNIKNLAGREATFFTLNIDGSAITLYGAEPYSFCKDSCAGNGTLRETILDVSISYDKLSELVAFCGSVKDLKTQPGEIVISPGTRALVFTDTATRDEYILDVGPVHPGHPHVLELFAELPELPAQPPKLLVSPDRLVRLGRTNPGPIKAPMSMVFKGFPRNSSKMQTLLCVKHGKTLMVVLATSSEEHVIQYLHGEDVNANIQEYLW